MLSSRLVALLALATFAAACHESSSSSMSREFTVNLGLSGMLYNAGNPGVMSVAESAEGDQNGAMYLIDVESQRTTNTGLGLGFAHEPLEMPPVSPVLCGGPTLAFGVYEGGADRNGDGDDDDVVLAYYDGSGARIVDVGLAVRRVISSEDLLAFDVPRIEVSPYVYLTEPFVHDLSSGESWSLGPVGALEVVAVGDGSVAMEAFEWVLGDLTHDGDEEDVVPALYDVRARTLQFIELPGFYGSQTHSEHRGRWIFGAFDPLVSTQLVVHDPSTGTSRRFPGYSLLRAAPEIEPIVLVKGADQSSWLYDPDTDALTDVGLAAATVIRAVTVLGQRFVFLVDERAQGEDLDGNGELSGAVPVLYDPATGATENLGLAGTAVPIGSGLLISSFEGHSRRDWNGDGDLEDSVLFTWDEHSGELVNTRVATSYHALGHLGDRYALLARDEHNESRDLNGDGDREDFVLHAYDLRTRRLINLGLAVYGNPSGDSQALFTVQEQTQGQDLNGDGDRDDAVLFATDLPASM